jgi:pyridoxamine 5'-phosphate oxidase
MDERDLDADPIRQIDVWLTAARAAGEPACEAMALATATADGGPSVRMVLLRLLDHRGLVFYTDRQSAKGRDLAVNPRAAALLHWRAPAHRQIRVTGPVEPVPERESEDYWASRPLGARRSAVASRQSSVIPSREVLEQRVAALASSDPTGSGPSRPERWGGYRITPLTVELWEEGADRLHDRIRYRRTAGAWERERLSP